MNGQDEFVKQMEFRKTEILWTLVTLSIPTVLEEVLATLLQYVDTAMVGRLGEQATAAVSVTTTITWLVNSVAGAVGVGVLTMIAQAVGRKDGEMIRRVSRQALLLVVGCAAVTGGLSVVLAPFIPVWMGAEKAVRGPASAYFLIVSLPMMFRNAATVLGAALRATRDTKTPMLINMASNLCNVALNYILIYKVGMGVVGAASASAVSYTLAGILMFVSYRRNALLRWEWGKRGGASFALVDWPVLQKCAQISVPVLGTGLASCLGYVVFAGLVSGMGTTIFAAHSIAVTAETIFYIPGYGLRTATSTMVGISLGEGNQKKFETVGMLSVFLTVGMMCVSGLVLYFTAYPLMRLFTPSGPVAALGAQMLKMVAFSEPFFGLMIVLEGIYYGLGRTKYAFVTETSSMWGIRILFSFLCVRVWELDLRAVWYCMIADNVCKAVLFVLPVLTRRGREAVTRQGN